MTDNYGVWIPVSERLPEEGTRVLVVWNQRKNVELIYAQQVAGLLKREGGWPYVTHWMPLPEPPK